ncbi:hypothetical protein SAMN06265348_114129 [Pedobacter westerhofensis]|uniref:SseB protein N-terminal domain-containing protein n=1 Tax=Pedobacter westerhofensis TaxID=425512 RepID=A0A521FN83_9SPHI|nr:hypothetical protein [Pedobacter westerhofensis]SMO97663.1 hypothetical protein SAMN06265348_114129 [Pedobacter westerhofensis]
MGLFDIFRKTDTAKAQAEDKTKQAPAAKADQPDQSSEPIAAVAAEIKSPVTPQRNSGDLKKTQALATLLEIPKEERTETWVNQFLADLPFAALRCGTPQLIAGPDGFPYFQLFIPAPGEEFQSYVIDEMISGFLVERGYGVVLNPGAGQPDWVLTYGDLLNYHLNGAFFTLDSLFSHSSNITEEVAAGEEIMVGQPSETILPAQTRKLLKDFFELNGIQGPKVMLMMRKNAEEVSQDLAFNITPDSFESEEHYRNMMQTVTWYLPRHYSVVGLHDSHVENGFMSL